MKIRIIDNNRSVILDTPAGFDKYASDGFKSEGIVRKNDEYLMTSEQFFHWSIVAKDMTELLGHIESLRKEWENEYDLSRLFEDAVSNFDKEDVPDLICYESVFGGAREAFNRVDRINESMKAIGSLLESDRPRDVVRLLQDISPFFLDDVASCASERVLGGRRVPLFDNPGTLRVVLEKYFGTYGSIGLKMLLLLGFNDEKLAHALSSRPELMSVVFEVCGKCGISPSVIAFAPDDKGNTVAEHAAFKGGADALKVVFEACSSEDPFFDLMESPFLKLCRKTGMDPSMILPPLPTRNAEKGMSEEEVLCFDFSR